MPTTWIEQRNFDWELTKRDPKMTRTGKSASSGKVKIIFKA